MALAYPELRHAVCELFDDTREDDGTPLIHLFTTSALSILNLDLSFGAIQLIIGRLFTNGYTVAIGYFNSTAFDKSVLAPRRGPVRKWFNGDRVVSIRREFKPSETIRNQNEVEAMSVRISFGHMPTEVGRRMTSA